MKYTIFYRRPNYNPYRSYFQNQDRYTAHVSVSGKEAAEAKAAEIIASGYTIKAIYNGIGKKVSI